jgi:nucleoside-diphosphate-sugar epimerase
VDAAKKNILITGGAGFIGSCLSRELSKIGHRVRVVDNRGNSEIEAQFDFKKVDLLDKKGLIEAIEGIDLVLHLAAKHRFFGVTEKEFFLVNETGTQNLLEAMDFHRVNSLVFFSSVAVYGDSDGATSETIEPKPVNPYGASKLAAEKLVRQWAAKDSSRRAVVIRPTVVFGPGNRGNVYRLIRQIYYRGYVPVGAGGNVKSIAYIDNVVASTLFLMAKAPDGVSIFNCADEPHMAYREIVNIIYTELGRNPPRFHLPTEPMLKAGRGLDKVLGAMGVQFSVETAFQKINKQTLHSAEKIKELGFQQSCSSDQGLREMVRWYLGERRRKEDGVS